MFPLRLKQYILFLLVEVSTEEFLILANARQGMIHSLSTHPGNNTRDLYPPIVNLRRPNTVEFDAEEEYIYFADVSTSSLGRRKYNKDDKTEFLTTQGNE